MKRQTRIVVEEDFHSVDEQERKRIFNELILLIIRKSEEGEAV